MAFKVIEKVVSRTKFLSIQSKYDCIFTILYIYHTVYLPYCIFTILIYPVKKHIFLYFQKFFKKSNNIP